MNTESSFRERWETVAKREPTGGFLYAVKSTGVYCKPGCPAPLPKITNVVFFDRCEAAEDAGFRACKRCAPVGTTTPQRQRQMIIEACRLIDESEVAPSLT